LYRADIIKNAHKEKSLGVTIFAARQQSSLVPDAAVYLGWKYISNKLCLTILNKGGCSFS